MGLSLHWTLFSQLNSYFSFPGRSTVFVSNLPYTATSTDLQTLFSDVAPIKTAFVVLDKETKVSKGVGYVTFAIKEDAGKCVQDGKVILNGRTLRVSWAGQKVRTLTLLNGEICAYQVLKFFSLSRVKVLLTRLPGHVYQRRPMFITQKLWPILSPSGRLSLPHYRLK